jgi:hypothetical protein
MSVKALDNPLIIGNEHQFVPIADSCIYKYHIKDDRFKDELILSLHRSSPSTSNTPLVLNGVCWTLRSNGVDLKDRSMDFPGKYRCRLIVDHVRDFYIRHDIDVRSVISNYPFFNAVIQKGEELVRTGNVPYSHGTQYSQKIFTCQVEDYFKTISRDDKINEVLDASFLVTAS